MNSMTLSLAYRHNHFTFTFTLPFTFTSTLKNKLNLLTFFLQWKRNWLKEQVKKEMSRHRGAPLCIQGSLTLQRGPECGCFHSSLSFPPTLRSRQKGNTPTSQQSYDSGLSFPIATATISIMEKCWLLQVLRRICLSFITDTVNPRKHSGLTYLKIGHSRYEVYKHRNLDILVQASCAALM